MQTYDIYPFMFWESDDDDPYALMPFDIIYNIADEAIENYNYN